MLKNRCRLSVEQLESRSLLSGLFGNLFNPSPAVQADLARIQVDQQALRADLLAQGPTLQKDTQALVAAIQTAYKADPNVQAAFTALQNHARTWQTTILADWRAIAAATNANRPAAIAHLQADVIGAAKALQADQASVQTALNSDAAVVAARAQLQADATRVSNDIAVLQADVVQLQKDLHG